MTVATPTALRTTYGQALGGIDDFTTDRGPIRKKQAGHATRHRMDTGHLFLPVQGACL